MIQKSEGTEAPVRDFKDDPVRTLKVYQVELGLQSEELLRIQLELEISRAKYYDLYDSATVGFCEIGSNGLIRQVNRSAARLLRMEAHDLVHLPFINLIHSEDLAIYGRLRHQIEESQEDSRCELRLKRNGNEFCWVELRGTWRLDPLGEGEIRFAISDISDRKQLEIEFHQAQKMEAFGQLAGGVAHDFNNIIATILFQVDLLKMQTGYNEDLRTGLRQIRIDALRAADLIRQLLTFSRKQVPQFHVIDLNGTVENLVKWNRRIIGDHISLEVNLLPRPLITLADERMLDQVMMNLMANSSDAMPQGGLIHIETSQRCITRQQAMGMANAKPGCYAVLTFSDTGCGIPPGILAQIFEPFFTTKEEGKGTGLGLATVYGIVLQHQGFMTVTSTVGKGTLFEIFLPASSAQLVVAADVIQPTKSVGGRETILLVEDQSTLRKLTGMLLESHGYRVLSAADGIEALEISRLYPGRIDLLLTDLQMPGGIGGQELGDRLSAVREDLRITFVSGGVVDTSGDRLCLSSKRIFVGKPIQPGVLLEVIRTCLDD